MNIMKLDIEILIEEVGLNFNMWRCHKNKNCFQITVEQWI